MTILPLGPRRSPPAGGTPISAAVKRRIAREGGGEAAGFRTIIVYRTGTDSFYVYGFAEKDKANVTSKELKALKALADTLLGLGIETVSKAVVAGELIEVRNDDQDGE